MAALRRNVVPWNSTVDYSADIQGGFTLPLFFTKTVAGKALEILSGTLNLVYTIGEVRDGDRGVQAKRREAT